MYAGFHYGHEHFVQALSSVRCQISPTCNVWLIKSETLLPVELRKTFEAISTALSPEIRIIPIRLRPEAWQWRKSCRFHPWLVQEAAVVAGTDTFGRR